jgi:hypothetical protein
MEFTALFGPPQLLGQTPEGDRKIVTVAGGTVEGDRIAGRVLPGGGHWTRSRADGVLELDVRLTIETDDGTLVCCRYHGLRHSPPEVLAALGRGEAVDPNAHYSRNAPRFEMGDERYTWLNRLLAIGTGERLKDGPRSYIREVL